MCALLILTPTNHRRALLIFLAGAGLGYFLELWDTTRESGPITPTRRRHSLRCWRTAMAVVAFWRAQLLLEMVASRWRN